LLDSPKAKLELVDELDSSRSTVDRAIRELETLGLIERSPRGCKPTLCGQRAIQHYSRFDEATEDNWNWGSPVQPVPELVAAPCQRIDIVTRLSEKPLDKRGLVAELDVSRSTVDRAVRKSEILELVEYIDGRYRPTQRGRSLAHEYRSFENRLAVIVRSRSRTPRGRGVAVAGTGQSLRDGGPKRGTATDCGKPFEPSSRLARCTHWKRYTKASSTTAAV
jgi:predicted transcriptional regulator